MKYDKFFALAKEAGIEEAELSVSTSNSLSISLFHGEIDNYSVKTSSAFKARGIINGKFGTIVSDTFKPEFFVDEIVKNAKVIENDDPAIIFKGSEKYHKIKTYNKELGNVPVQTKIDTCFALEKKLGEIDERIVDIEGVHYSEGTTSFVLMNSHGLNLKDKTNNYMFYGAVIAKDEKSTKSGFEIVLDNDFSKINVDDIATKAVQKAVAQLGGEPCESKTYKAVLDAEVFANFVEVYMNHASSEEVQKNSSLFAGKLGQKVASRKVTIEDKPLQKGSVYSRWFDDEGVATYNKPIIKNGVLQTYLYNLSTAAKEGVESTGNGFGGSKIGVSPAVLVVKPGKKTKEELFQEVGDGVYITEVSGMHAGMNSQSGNFSLQSTGFLIKDGKLDRALDVITVSGNLVDLFNDVVEVSNENIIIPGGVTSSAVLLKKLNVGGK